MPASPQEFERRKIGRAEPVSNSNGHAKFEEASMATTSIRIKNYEYYVFSSRDSATPPSTVILLYDQNNAWVAALWFVKEGGALPTASQSGGRYILSYSYAELAVIVDMLRNESPIYLIVDPAGTNLNWRVSTLEEPVGEGEV